MNLVLLGYRGSGKTSVGRLLAERLNMSFVDTDDCIVEHFGGMTIRDIWARHGEPAFRKAEVEQVRLALNDDHQVIALGGGAVMQPGARDALETAASDGRCIRIYLRAKAQTLCARIHADAATAANRPGLTSMGGDLNEVQSVLAERESTYLSQADLIVDVDNLNIVQIVDRIVSLLDRP